VKFAKTTSTCSRCLLSPASRPACRCWSITLELGADRLVNAIAAFERYGGPCIVVDFGTATTFDVISAKASIWAAPSHPAWASAPMRSSRAPPAERVDIKRPAKVIGTNTVTHLQTGLYYGYIGLVDGILERIVAELGAQPRVIATGGLARQISEDSRFIAEIDDMLTLDGLLILFERNRAAKPRGKRTEKWPNSTTSITSPRSRSASSSGAGRSCCSPRSTGR